LIALVFALQRLAVVEPPPPPALAHLVFDQPGRLVPVVSQFEDEPFDRRYLIALEIA
jgi:hypothetical protein